MICLNRIDRQEQAKWSMSKERETNLDLRKLRRSPVSDLVQISCDPFGRQNWTLAVLEDSGIDNDKALAGHQKCEVGTRFCPALGAAQHF